MNNETDKIFSNLIIEGIKISDFELVLTSFDDNYRLYFHKDPNGYFFNAIALSFESCNSINDKWNCPELIVSELFRFELSADESTHLEFNRYTNKEERGYIYCPDMNGLIELLNKAKQIKNHFLNNDKTD